MANSRAYTFVGSLFFGVALGLPRVWDPEWMRTPLGLAVFFAGCLAFVLAILWFFSLSAKAFLRESLGPAFNPSWQRKDFAEIMWAASGAQAARTKKSKPFLDAESAPPLPPPAWPASLVLSLLSFSIVVMTLYIAGRIDDTMGPLESFTFQTILLTGMMFCLQFVERSLIYPWLAWYRDAMLRDGERVSASREKRL